ncbi:flagellin N-terminal helical domain-containing protein [Allorhizobium terrae]|uniref:Flagellin n=1 Tax=Allorhizobium terrae TaxID=1848972 RepID=A0A4S3ZPQ0_9HYPH|nr:flagellin [Allorhizobium terrae]THF47494.1 flagellin [Allorhizobium terrae]TWD48213.1 flagellin [Agrobacterium vitis]
MVSKNTNVTAYTALQSLRNSGMSLSASQSRMTTGYRVDKPSDNAAYWSIATTMRSDNRSIASVQDALNMAGSVIDTASNGMRTATDLMSDVKARLISARDTGVDRNKINSELDEMRRQFRSIAESSSFSQENWLQRSSTADRANRDLVGSFVRDNSGMVTVNTINYDINGKAGTSEVNYLIDDVEGERGILTGSGFSAELGTAKTWVMFNGTNAGTNYNEIRLSSNTSTTDIDEMIQVVDLMTERMTDVATQIGAMGTRVDMQFEFSKQLQGSISKGVGGMVDANMDEESNRLKALQVREQLGIKSLSIVNTSVQSVLQLL